MHEPESTEDNAEPSAPFLTSTRFAGEAAHEYLPSRDYLDSCDICGVALHLHGYLSRLWNEEIEDPYAD